MAWNIIVYATLDEREPVHEFITSLRSKLRAKAIWEIDLLAQYGLSLHEPYVKTIKGEKYKGLWELRIQQGTDSARIFYFMATGKDFVLLNGFLKKTNKTPKQELEKALGYMNDYIDRERGSYEKLG
jgi:phage-related protein